MLRVLTVLRAGLVFTLLLWKDSVYEGTESSYLCLWVLDCPSSRSNALEGQCYQWSFCKLKYSSTLNFGQHHFQLSVLFHLIVSECEFLLLKKNNNIIFWNDIQSQFGSYTSKSLNIKYTCCFKSVLYRVFGKSQSLDLCTWP